MNVSEKSTVDQLEERLIIARMNFEETIKSDMEFHQAKKMLSWINDLTQEIELKKQLS